MLKWLFTNQCAGEIKNGSFIFKKLIVYFWPLFLLFFYLFILNFIITNITLLFLNMQKLFNRTLFLNYSNFKLKYTI